MVTNCGTKPPVQPREQKPCSFRGEAFSGDAANSGRGMVDEMPSAGGQPRVVPS